MSFLSQYTSSDHALAQRFVAARSHAGIFAVALLICAGAVFALSWAQDEEFHPGIEVVKLGDAENVSYSQAKKQFVKNARRLIWNGIKSCKGAFQVVTTSGPEIILPSRYINEIARDDRFSMNGFVERDFFSWTPGFEGSRTSITSTVVQDMVRMKLTQSLNLITKDLCEETDAAIHDTFGESSEWKNIRFMWTSPNLVARLSSRVFLGKKFARDGKWNKISTRYTIALIFAARGLRFWPKLLQPYIHWVLPQCIYLRHLTRQGRRLIDKELKERRAIRAENIRNGIKTSKTADSLGWMMDLAEGRTTTDGRPFDFTGAQLGLTFAAIHTTSDLLTKCMYNLVSYPECITALRAEMVDILSREGFKKTSLFQMKLLDSFMKETQRINGPSLTLMNRVVVDDVTLSDGTKIPKGASVKAFLDNHWNADLYPDPDTFDMYRFAKLRAQPGQENSWQFVTTSAEHAGFGHGTHACPGRFFASNEVKIALCFLLLKYDWRLEDDTKKPKNIDVAMESIGDPWVKIQYSRRQEELDLAALASV